MPKNKIEDLRNHLFEVIEKLKEGEMERDTAKTIADVAQVIINTAKVEVDFMKHVGGTGSDFIPAEKRQPLPHENENRPRLVA